MKVKKSGAEKIKKIYLIRGLIILVIIVFIIIVSLVPQGKVLFGPVVNERLIEGSEGDDRVIARDGKIYVKISGENIEKIIDCNFLYIVLKGGNDYVDLVKCNDFDFGIEGGAGDDEIYSGEGYDRINGGDGNDIIRSGGGNDNISSGLGSDKLFGEDGDDLLRGDDNDFLDGGEGENIILRD